MNNNSIISDQLIIDVWEVKLNEITVDIIYSGVAPELSEIEKVIKTKTGLNNFDNIKINLNFETATNKHIKNII